MKTLLKFLNWLTFKLGQSHTNVIRCSSCSNVVQFSVLPCTEELWAYVLNSIRSLEQSGCSRVAIFCSEELTPELFAKLEELNQTENKNHFVSGCFWFKPNCVRIEWRYS